MHASKAVRRAATASTWTLANGARIPKIGFGTWKMSREQAGPAVSHALETGFRQIDSAWAYKNEDATGDAIRKSGIDRKDLWITSKLWNTFHGDRVELGLDTTLKDLGVDYLDLYLMHWPVAFANPNSSQVSSIKSMGGKPVEDTKLSHDLAATWLKMEEMVRKGKVRNIGVSNFNIRRTEELLLASTETNPVINQVEVNFGVPNEELLHYSEAHQIMLQAYSPLGGPNYHEKYLYDPIINDVASRNNMTPAQVMLAWPIARGIIPLTKSVTPQRIEETFAASQMKLSWEDVVHLNNEAQARPIDRSMDPTETWALEDDIFEDYKDQTLLNSLKGEAFHAARPHEADGSHYLEPRNDPTAPKLGPGGTAIREIHTMAGRGVSSSSPRGGTVVQQMMKGRRAFSTTSRRPASTTSETATPSLEQALGLSASSSNPILRGKSAKSATLTPGIHWTDGQVGLERQVRKMNMYTVGTPLHLRSFSTSTARRARVFTPRKTFLYDQYKRLLQQSKIVLILQPNSLSVKEAAKIRREVDLVPLDEISSTSSNSIESKAKLAMVRTGLMRPLVRKTSALKPLEALLSGPVALLTFDHLSPSYLSRVLKVIDRALGAGKAQVKPEAGQSHAKAIKNVNSRIVPLAAIIENGKSSIKVVNVAELRDVSLLPSLDEIRGQLVALLSNAPSQLVSTLNQAKGVSLLRTLDARRIDLESASSISSSSSPSA